MAEVKPCAKCHKRPARVKLIRLVGGKAESLFLCEECAAEVSPYKPLVVPFQEVLEKALDQLLHKATQEDQAEAEAGAEPRCPSCGMTLALYRSSFRLGCSHCYRTFEKALESQMRRYHGSTRHVGRTPPWVTSGRSDNDDAVADLRRDLARAVEQEDFEKAVELRNRIRSLETQVSDGSPEMPKM